VRKLPVLSFSLACVLATLVGCSGGDMEPPPTVGVSEEAPADSLMDEPAASESVADVSSLDAVLEISSQQDFMREFYLDGTQLTSRFVLIRGISSDGGDVAVDIATDPSGLDDFTLAPADALYEVNPFNGLFSIAMNFPGFEYVPGVQVSTFSGSNGQTSVIFSVDSQGLLRNVEYTSPEYTYVENFSYGSEFEETVPREFVERVNADREQSGLDVSYGYTQDGFMSWEVTSF
jgi:hypothetical protein